MNCRHYWIAVSDEQGDPREAHLWAEFGYMECMDCGETRDITAADEAKLRDEAQYAEWEARR